MDVWRKLLEVGRTDTPATAIIRLVMTRRLIKELMRRSVQFALERSPKPAITNGDVDAALDELLFSGGRLNAALLGASGARPEEKQS